MIYLIVNLHIVLVYRSELRSTDMRDIRDNRKRGSILHNLDEMKTSSTRTHSPNLFCTKQNQESDKNLNQKAERLW